jgi:hypothetical protein
MHRRVLSLAIALLVASVSVASAGWPAGGQFVSTPDNFNGVRNVQFVELSSGDFAIVGVGTGGNSNTYNLQRISRDGIIAAGWPAAGITLPSIIKMETLHRQSFVTDADGYVWHTYASGTNAVAQYFTPAGAALPSAISGTTLGSSGGAPVHAAPATGGDMFISTGSNRIRRITRSFAAAAGWLSTGVVVPGTSYDDNALHADGTGGVVVFMRSSATTQLPIVTRLDGDGAVHAGWPVGGLALSSTITPLDFPGDSKLFASGPDHWIAAWTTLVAGPNTRKLWLQRFKSDGTLDPAWPADGLQPVSTPDSLLSLTLFPDGSGGLYVVRFSGGVPKVVHVAVSGTLLGTPSDVNPLDAGAQYVPTHVPGTIAPDAMIADCTPDGRLMVGWTDARLAPDIRFRLRWLLPDLTPDPTKPDAGVVITPGSPHPEYWKLSSLHSDGAGGAFVAWRDYHESPPGNYWGDVWMTRVLSPELVDVAPPRVLPNASLLSAPRPNPARESVELDLTLADDGSARVELLDVAGRVMRSQLVEGAGPHAITFDALGSLAPGLYFARVISRDRSAAVRVVVSR